MTCVSPMNWAMRSEVRPQTSVICVSHRDGDNRKHPFVRSGAGNVISVSSIRQRQKRFSLVDDVGGKLGRGLASDFLDRVGRSRDALLPREGRRDRRFKKSV